MVKINTIIFESDESSLKKASEIIKSGGVVAFPTETVYGIGADVFNENAVKKIFEAKGRPSDNPLIVHISDFKMLDKIVEFIPDNAKILMDAFMPGPITIIMKKKPEISKFVTGGLDTVAVRFPSHPVAQKLIEQSQTPIPAPSANLSGKPSPTSAQHVIDDMFGRVDAIINGGECEAGVESTVVDCTGNTPIILRPGIITLEDVKQYIPTAEISPSILETIEPDDQPRCPGMKYKHYAPDAPLTVVEGPELKVSEKIRSIISANPGKKIGVLSCSNSKYDADVIIRVKDGNKAYAHSLFSNLRQFDKSGVDMIIAEFCFFDKYTVTVKNRLYKSAANNIIYV